MVCFFVVSFFFVCVCLLVWLFVFLGFLFDCWFLVGCLVFWLFGFWLFVCFVGTRRRGSPTPTM